MYKIEAQKQTELYDFSGGGPMKPANFIRIIMGILIIPFLGSLLVLQPQEIQAQESGYIGVSEKFSQKELAQMLAPIALYPDVLLTQVLMASTYPIEVIQADRWVKKNPEAKGQTLDDALLTEDWDPSVKALCHFPSVLALMSEQISETTNIGNAFLAQEDEVMDMIQELRAKAHAQGNLNTTKEQKVIIEKETIIIEPADPLIVYVPYYDPLYIYGPWWYPGYPPYYWGPSRVSLGIGISYWPGFYFGFAFGNWSYFDWHQHYIFIDVYKRPRFVHRDRWRRDPGRWIHTPRHRRGVAYRDKSTARKFGQLPRPVRKFTPDTRGFPERRNLDREMVRRFDDRSRIDRNIRSERTRTERAGSELRRLERDRELQQPSDLGARIERPQRDQQQQTRVVPGRTGQPRIERDLQLQQRVDRARRTGERLERQQRQKSRENVFNSVESGRREIKSSTRGRSSRQGLDRNYRERSRSKDDFQYGREERGNRDDRGRNRR